MPVNIEIKAKAADWEGQLRLARALSDRSEELVQEDTFFDCRGGRLKLRDLGPGGESCLIYYRRDDEAGPKSSHYDISPTRDPAGMKALLSRALGRSKTVKKRRTVLFTGQTRLHFDEVEGLGRFIEIEVCLRPGQDDREGTAIARGLMARLGIEDSALLEGAYVDMLA